MSLTEGERTLVVDALWHIHQCKLSWSLSFWHPRPGHTRSLKLPVLGHLRLNNQQGEKTAPFISDKFIPKSS